MKRSIIHSLHNVPAGENIFVAECVAKNLVGKNIFSLKFTAQPDTEKNTFSFKPGQWIDVFIPNVETVGGFSLTSTMSTLPNFELAVKRANHPPTTFLTEELKVGEKISVRAGGEFFWEQEPYVLLVAGGIGINPCFSIFKAMSEYLDDLVERNVKTELPKVALLYTAKDAESLIFVDEIEEQGLKHPHNIFVCARSSEIDGRLTEVEVDEALAFLRPRDAANLSKSEPKSNPVTSFLVGPPTMCEDFESLLLSKGVNCRVERWW